MDPTLESREAENKETVIFNANETSGGMVNNVNGNLTMGDYINGDQVHINIYLTHTAVATEGNHLHRRRTYPRRYPPNEADTDTGTVVVPSHGVRQTQYPSTFKPFTGHIDADVIIQACCPPGSADRALIEIQVITDIMDALMESSSLRHSAKLPETIASLQRILKLTKLAIRVYQDTPLAQTLGLAIIAEAEHCRQLLKKLLSSLVNCRHTLSAAMLHFIREYIWSRTGECNVSNDLDSKLRDCHGSFAACVLALGSLASYELEWGAGTGDLAELHNFSLLFKQESTSLQHIQIDTVIVVDHLARRLPMPIVFCKSWQNINVVITGFCKDSAGGMLIKRGDYRILNSDDDEVINPLHFSTVLQPGMTVEMSVVLHERAEERYGSEEHRCPRCNHINNKVITASGWVKCRRCGGRFQISPEDDSMVLPALRQAESAISDTPLFRRICVLTGGARETGTQETGTRETNTTAIPGTILDFQTPPSLYALDEDPWNSETPPSPSYKSDDPLGLCLCIGTYVCLYHSEQKAASAARFRKETEKVK